MEDQRLKKKKTHPQDETDFDYKVCHPRCVCKKKYPCLYLYFRISYLFVHSYLQETIGVTGN